MCFFILQGGKLKHETLGLQRFGCSSCPARRKWVNCSHLYKTRLQPKASCSTIILLFYIIMNCYISVGLKYWCIHVFVSGLLTFFSQYIRQHVLDKNKVFMHAYICAYLYICVYVCNMMCGKTYVVLFFPYSLFDLILKPTNITLTLLLL